MLQEHTLSIERNKKSRKFDKIEREKKSREEKIKRIGQITN